MASDGPIMLDMNFFLAVAYSMIQKVFSQVKCKVPNWGGGETCCRQSCGRVQGINNKHFQHNILAVHDLLEGKLELVPE